MDKKIIQILDDCDIDQINDLLDNNIDIKIGKGTKDRIKNSVYKKAGMKKRSYNLTKIVAASIILAAFISSTYMVGFDTIATAFQGLFKFIPEYGIVENNDSIKFILAEQKSVRNEDTVFTLNNAIAGRNDITVMFTLEDEYVQDRMRSVYENIVLVVNGKRYTQSSASSSSGGKISVYALMYKVDAEDIQTAHTYILEYKDMQIEFSLKDYESFDALDEIGDTESKNNISITAVPTFLSENQVEVNLYPINKSGYSLDSFFDPRSKKDLHLESNSGVKPYNQIKFYGTAHGKFTFDIDPTDKDFTLRIPFLIIQSVEQQDISLKIPKEGETVKSEIRIPFKDSDVIITELEKTNEDNQENGELKMTFRFENKTSNMRMIRTGLLRLDVFGNINGGGYSEEIGEDGLMNTVWFALEDGDKDKLRLRLTNPRYYIDDDYSLDFSRE